jgi:ATPase family associated with various cellular activities (AAA)
MVNFNDFEQKAIPKTLNEVCFGSAAARSHMYAITSGNHGFPGSGMNGIILHGPVGAGKTTLARMIPDLMEKTNIGMDSLWREEYNIAKGNSGVDFINKINDICYSSNWDSELTYVILNEVNNLSADAMSQLKSIMDNHQKRVVFIMTTNEFHKLEKGVIDRSYCFDFNDVPGYVWIAAMRRVLKAYGISAYSDAQLTPIGKSYNGSGRWFARDIKRLIDGYYKKYPHQYTAFLAAQAQTSSVTTTEQATLEASVSA